MLLFVHSTVRSTAFTTQDIVVSGSDDRTVKVSVPFCVVCLGTGVVIPDIGVKNCAKRAWETLSGDLGKLKIGV